MVLHLSPDHVKAIATHAERTYPEECCGLLLGKLTRQNQQESRTLVEVLETQNAWSEETAAEMQDIVNQSAALGTTKTSRYWIDPQDLLNGQRYARDRQLDIIGIYHSHPNHSAVPSECDRTLAWSHYSYMIVSVQQGEAQDVRCWSLDDQHQFQAEDLCFTPTENERSR
jgi:proteasome lid subunit RPN8/RPN11